MPTKTIISVLFILIVAGFLLSLRGGESTSPPEEPAATATTTDPAIASALAGTYISGRLPAADAPYREYSLVLRENGQAALTTEYPERDPIVTTGTWQVRDGTLTLRRKTGGPLSFAVNGQTLRLVDFDQNEWGSAGLTFTRPEEPSGAAAGTSTLTGTRWQWQQTVRAGGSELVPEDPTAFLLTFDGDGTMRATTDCNSLRGRYAVGIARSLTLDDIGSTRMACPEAQGPVFQADLASVTRFRTDGDTLILTLASGGSMELVDVGSTADSLPQ